MFDERVTPAQLRKLSKRKGYRPNPLPKGESMLDRMTDTILAYGPSRKKKRTKKRG